MLKGQSAGIPVVTWGVERTPKPAIRGKTRLVIKGGEVIRSSKTVLEIVDDQSFLCSVKEVSPRLLLEKSSISSMIKNGLPDRM